jgi:hypothetical protein
MCTSIHLLLDTWWLPLACSSLVCITCVCAQHWCVCHLCVCVRQLCVSFVCASFVCTLCAWFLCKYAIRRVGQNHTSYAYTMQGIYLTYGHIRFWPTLVICSDWLVCLTCVYLTSVSDLCVRQLCAPCAHHFCVNTSSVICVCRSWLVCTSTVCPPLACLLCKRTLKASFMYVILTCVCHPWYV